jgi:2-keto-3-deoxy-L-rhamnonate aldolase RhmA
MTNSFDVTYFGTIFVGFPEPQELKVVFDTGSDWLVIESSHCENCLGQNFNPDLSHGYKG